MITDCKTWWSLWWDACHIGTVASETALKEIEIHVANCPTCLESKIYDTVDELLEDLEQK